MSLLAEELFDYATGAIHGQNGGTGWAEAWRTQNDDETVFLVVSGSQEYEGLENTGNSLEGGGGFLDCGRKFTTSLNTSGTWYIAAVLNKYNGDTDDFQFGVHDSSTSWLGNDSTMVGIFGSDSVVGGEYFWSFRDENTGAVSVSNVQLEQNTPTLAVMKIEFGASNATVSCFFNPSLDSEPATPDIQETITNADAAFQSVWFVPGNNTNLGAVDAIRIGDTWSSVLPQEGGSEPEPDTTSIPAINVGMFGSSA